MIKIDTYNIPIGMNQFQEKPTPHWEKKRNDLVFKMKLNRVRRNLAIVRALSIAYVIVIGSICVAIGFIPDASTGQAAAIAAGWFGFYLFEINIRDKYCTDINQITFTKKGKKY